MARLRNGSGETVGDKVNEPPRGDFIYFDEIEDVLSPTDLLADVIPKLPNSPQYWKWAIIAAHSAVQGAMVCVLHDTAGVSVLDDKSARALLRWYDGQGDYPTKQWLAEFLILRNGVQTVN